ncbi:hypothetical protein D3C87_1742080 [compost metagenome]
MVRNGAYAALVKGETEEEDGRQKRHPQRIGNRIAGKPCADTINEGVGGNHEGVDERDNDRLSAAAPRLEGKRQDAAGNDGNPGKRKRA